MRSKQLEIKFTAMKTTDLKVGTILETDDGKKIEIAKATSNRISWYIGFTCRSAGDKKTERMAWCTRKQAQGYLDSGWWRIINY